MERMSETLGRLDKELQQSNLENAESKRTIENLDSLLKRKSSSDISSNMKLHVNFMKFAQSVQKFSGRGVSIDRWFKEVEQSAMTVMPEVLDGPNQMFVLCIIIQKLKNMSIT